VRCNVVWFDRQAPIFWRYLLPPSAGYESHLILTIQKQDSSRVLVSVSCLPVENCIYVYSFIRRGSSHTWVITWAYQKVLVWQPHDNRKRWDFHNTSQRKAFSNCESRSNSRVLVGKVLNWLTVYGFAVHFCACVYAEWTRCIILRYGQSEVKNILELWVQNLCRACTLIICLLSQLIPALLY